MRYYDKIQTPLTGKTFLEAGDNRVPQADMSVITWFQPLPEGYKRAFSEDGLPFNALIPPQTVAEIEANAQAVINSDSLAYLASTDWYVTRFTESGVAVPADVTQARTDARLAIV